jgi:hypothetical protein
MTWTITVSGTPGSQIYSGLESNRYQLHFKMCEDESQYPRVEINPAHCGIYNEYHDKNGERHVQDGSYVVRRKVISADGKYGTITLDGQEVRVQRIFHEYENERTVKWQTHEQEERR